jgi:AAA family ATP:ADP antiporter
MFGTYGLLLIAALGVAVCISLTIMADRWTLRRVSEQEATKAEAPLGKEGGFHLIFRDRYLLLVATLTVLLNVVSTSGEFLLRKLVVQQSLHLADDAARKVFVGEFYATSLAG